jgi:bla regulator protein BlaR1
MQTLLEIGLANALMASALAVLAAFASLFCRRPVLRHSLWLLVLLKLITPPFLPVPIRCPSALRALLPNQDGVGSAHGSSEVPSPDFQHAAVADAANPTEEEEILDLPVPSAPALGKFSPSTASSQRWLMATYLLDWTVANFSALVFTIWCVGAVLWFSLALKRIYCFHRLLGYGRAAPAPLQDQTRVLAQRLGLAHCPTVWLVPGRVSPLLWALGRSLSLVVPADLLDRLEPEQRDSLLAHELAHALRRDHWVRWLELAVSGLYWWLPVAWWARREIQQAEEECCDAWVVWTLPAVAKAYAKALLQTVDFLDARPALPPVASGIGLVPLLKRRLAMIVKQPFCPQLPWPVHLGVIVLGLLVLPLAPQRLVAQNVKSKPVPELADDTAPVRAEQDPADRDVERRLRALEQKMDRLMQMLEGQKGKGFEFDGKPYSFEDKGRAKEKAERAKEKARAAEAQKIEPKQLAEILKEIKQKLKAEKELDPAQIQGIIDAIQGTYRKDLGPQLKDFQKRFQAEMDKNFNPQRKEEIQRKIEEGLKKSTQQMNEALKRSTQQLERAQTRLREAERARANEPNPEKFGSQEQRELERRMDRLEKKLDRVLQALEKSGKSSRQAF